MIRLEKVSGRNVWQLLELEVAEQQKSFVATNSQSLVEAYLALASGGHAWPFGIYDEDRPVGFVMIGYGTDDDWEDPPALAENSYSIWRLMVDKSCQHRGIGRQALWLALDFIRTWPCGEAEYCYLSYEPENIIAKALYASMGFEETGDMDGEELLAVLKL